MTAAVVTWTECGLWPLLSSALQDTCTVCLCVGVLLSKSFIFRCQRIISCTVPFMYMDSIFSCEIFQKLMPIHVSLANVSQNPAWRKLAFKQKWRFGQTFIQPCGHPSLLFYWLPTSSASFHHPILGSIIMTCLAAWKFRRMLPVHQCKRSISLSNTRACMHAHATTTRTTNKVCVYNVLAISRAGW